MTAIDVHLRRLIKCARDKQSRCLVDDALELVEEHSDRFNADFSPELLVLLAEVASDLREREPVVIRALELYDRLQCEDDQFKVRALLVRCVYEARLGTQTFQLKGQHLQQQLKYALTFLTSALSTASKPGNDAKYGFLVSNASLVFWHVIRPMCRSGWQSHVVKETEVVLSALRAVAQSSGSGLTGAEKGKAGGPGAAGATLVPVAVAPMWLVEVSLNLAFGYEDAGDLTNAQKTLDSASALLEDALKQEPLAEPRDPRKRIRELVWNARAHFARKQPDKVKQEINVASGGGLLGTALFICNGGIPREKCEDELVAAWNAIDAEFDLREAAKAGALGTFPQDVERPGPHRGLNPQRLVELALAARVGCTVGCFPLARAMLSRLEAFQVPAGRGRILLDLARAELDIWEACRPEHRDPTSQMLFGPGGRARLEVEARQRAVRLCEQCLMAARRIEDVGLVEESAVVLWNAAHELLSSAHRLGIHKSLQKCADVLEEIQSIRLVRLRVQLHLEISYCEVAQDLLTKGAMELCRARAIDYTTPESELSEATRRVLEDRGLDPALHLRGFDEAIEQQHHLLQLKLSLYEEPDKPADQVLLLLDQVQRQRRGGVHGERLAFNVLTQAYAKLEAALDELSDERLQARSSVVEKRRLVLNSGAALQPLPHQAPATVREGGPSEPDVAIIRDRRPKSERELAVAHAKSLVMLMCRVGLEAKRLGQQDFAIRACDRAICTVLGTSGIAASPPRWHPSGDVFFGPPPIEVEGALLLAEAAYTKAQCLSLQLEELGLVNGLDEEAAEGEPMKEGFATAGSSDSRDPGEMKASRRLEPQERAKANLRKRELVLALLLGMEIGCEFEQWWVVTNGLALWWNLHLRLVESQGRPQLLSRCAIPEYHAGLREMQAYFCGERRLPSAEFRHALVSNLVLAHLDAAVSMGQLSALEVDQLLVIKRLQPTERREVVARVTELCRTHDRPLPDLGRLRPERLEGQVPTAAPGKAAPAAKTAPAVVPSLPEDWIELQGYEADVAMLTANIPWAKDSNDAQKNCVDRAVELLNRWEPAQDDEVMLTLWVRLWTELGRRCLGKPMASNVGAKCALMCCVKGLGAVDAPLPKHAGRDRLHWRGACHALCGEAFHALVEPRKQEKESLQALRCMSLAQFQRSCDYAHHTSSAPLALSSATSLWRVALPMLAAAETRKALAEPLCTVTRTLAAVPCHGSEHFLVDLYSSLFKCYIDMGQWRKIHEMLGEAFQAVPSTAPQAQRRLWALQMLALSQQGEDVAVAMGRMKENQASAQARIWMVLSDVSPRQLDQFNAYTKAIEILENARQPDVVEVRMQFADWLLRNGFGACSAQEQLAAAACLLLGPEEDSEEEEEADVISSRDVRESLGTLEERDQVDARSRQGDGGQGRGSFAGSDAGLPGEKKAGRSQSAGARSKGSSKALSSKRSAVRLPVEEQGRSGKGCPSAGMLASVNGPLSSRLHAHDYEALCRIFAARGRLGLGSDAHHALLAAAHFAVRFFSCTAELANSLVQQLMERDAQEERSGHKSTRSVINGTPGLEAKPDIRDEQGEEVPEMLPPFNIPVRLSGWASDEAWPWHSRSTLAEVIARAEQAGLLHSKGGCYWAGCPGTFEHPPLSFHAFVQLEDDLEEHGYHFWALPILALHLQLGRALEHTALSNAVMCLAHLRLSRFASECRMETPAAEARSTGMQELEQVSSTFGLFEEELQQAHGQQLGGGGTGTLRPDWLQTPTPGVAAPWLCSKLHAYEVWAELGRECLLHGEMWMAYKLVNQAGRHAEEYGDRRTLRTLLVTKARLAMLEGRSLDGIRFLGQVTAADARQATEVALLLADAYRNRQRHDLADDTLSSALGALRATAEPHMASERCTQEPCNQRILAECTLRNAQLHAQLAALVPSHTIPTHEWTTRLDSAFQLHYKIGEELQRGAFHRRRVAACADFARAMVHLIEGHRIELVSRCGSGGEPGFELLASYASWTSEVVATCFPSRDELLLRTFPTDGSAEGAVLPAEMLAARLDTWGAAARGLCRTLTAAVGPVSSPGAAGPMGEGRIGEWLRKEGGRLDQVERVCSFARDATEVEASVALVSNAVTLLGVRTPGAPHAPAEAAVDGASLPTCTIEALVELGQLQLELSEQRSLQQSGTKWDGIAADACELQGMEVGERCSNVLFSRDPSQIFDMHSGTAGKPVEMDTGDGTSEVAFAQLAKATLRDGVRASLESRHFSTATRGLRALALRAYGFLSAEAALEFLMLLQSSEVCARAEKVLHSLLPTDHPECVQMRLLKDLEQIWSFPQSLGTYASTVARLQLESPWFQRLQLGRFPAVNALLLTHFPPLTLVVTLQIHEHWLFVGAACSPPEGEAEQRSQELRHLALRWWAPEQQLQHCIGRLWEIAAALERGLLAATMLDAELAERQQVELLRLDTLLAEPLALVLAGRFWPLGLHLEHRSNPRQLVLLPDAGLWDLPLERLPSMAALFGAANHAAVSRDLSLHVAAQRVHRFLDAPDGEPSVLKAPLLAAKHSTTVLLTDPFNEDVLSSADPPKSETMPTMHERLLRDKIIGGEERSLHGRAQTASPEDIKGMLADASAFYSIGFCSFFSAISPGHFASQNLQHIALLALFHRAINDRAFRRQTKINSTRTAQELAVEDAFRVSLLAAFRGVLCTVLTVAPVPVPISIRCFEVFAREMKEGRAVAKAMEKVLGQLITNPEFRCARTLEGGILPGDPAQSSATDTKGRPDSRVSSDMSSIQELLPLHARTAYLVVGAPWLAAENVDAGGRKK